jgi:hypothetical protein
VKYAYIITRTFTRFEPGITELPNLGVHSTFKKALEHYESVKADRAKFGPVSSYQHGERDRERYVVLREFYTLTGESVRLERWIISRGKQ